MAGVARSRSASWYALPLHAAEAEALGGEAALETVGAGAPRAAELLVLVEIERDRGVGKLEVEGCQAERRETRSGLSRFDDPTLNVWPAAARVGVTRTGPA
jgi:sirohydrochlorin ferrochelatase